jgi:transposase
MYIKHCKLSRNKQLELLKYFVAGCTARTASELLGIHRNTGVRFFCKLREKIALKQQNRIEQFCGKIELDESYFGGHRKGKRGRGAGGKVAVFGILKRGGEVYTQVILDAKTDTLMPIIREKIRPDSVVYTDYWRSYNALDVSEFKHFRINHSKVFADNHNHINGIEKLASPRLACLGFASGLRRLESSETTHAKVQRNPKRKLQSLLERVRMEV